MAAHMQPCTCPICHSTFADFLAFESHLCVVSLGDEGFIRELAHTRRETHDLKILQRKHIMRWHDALALFI